MTQSFSVVSDFKATGDQPEAIKHLSKGVEQGLKHQTLLGVTGSGKTFTIANMVAEIQRPTLVIAHNKTLAAQLATEFKEFLPNNAVEYFASSNIACIKVEKLVSAPSNSLEPNIP